MLSWRQSTDLGNSLDEEVISHLAPMIGVFCLKTTMSKNKYSPAGIVAKAVPKGQSACGLIHLPHEITSVQLTPDKHQQRDQRPLVLLKPLHQRHQTQHVQKHMYKTQVYQRVRVEPVHGLQADLFRYQSAPLSDGPDALELEEPEGDADEQDDAGKERQAEEVGP